jgi:hypothetical protein
MTAKSKTALGTQITTDFADNTAGDISAGDNRNILTDLRDSTLGCYGAMYVFGGATAQSLTTTSAKITAFTTNGISDNTTPLASSDQITVAIAGDYHISCTITLTGTSTHVYIFRPAINGTVVANVGTRFTNAGTAQFQLAFACLSTLAASDVVTLYGESNQGGGSNVTVIDAQLIVRRVG